MPNFESWYNRGMDKYKILLYYKYVRIDDPAAVMNDQRALCEKLDIKGRILIAHEGINGTVAGLESDIDEYIRETAKSPLFSDIEWKVSWAGEQVFPKLKVRVRDEIVTLGLSEAESVKALDGKANYIEPEELLALYEDEEDFLIIDARNNYEAEIGKFKNALIPSIDNFRDFPKFVDSIKDYKDKTVVTYCTGGVRCEKASGYMRQQGFKDVRQLHGGVHVYGEKVGGKYFEGELFVFDKRLHAVVNSVNPSVLSKCIYCGCEISRYIDCAVASCNELFICCENCEAANQGVCSDFCLQELEGNVAVL